MGLRENLTTGSGAESVPLPAPGGIWGFDWLNHDLRWLLLLRALRSFAQGYLAVITPLYVALLGYDAAHLGILFGVAGMANALLSGASGILADRFGRKFFLVLISLMMATGAVAFALTRNFGLLVVAEAIGSLGRGGALGGDVWGPFYPAAEALVAEQTRDIHRTTVFGALSFIGVLSGALGSLLAALPRLLNLALGVSPLAGYRLLFLLTGPLGIATALAVSPVRELHLGESRRGARAHGGPYRSNPPLKGPPKVLGLSARSWRLVFRFMITNATNGLSIGMLGPFVVYWFYRRFGVTGAELAGLFFVLNAFCALPYLMAGRIALAMGSVRAVVFTRTISTALLFGVVLMPTFLTAAALYTLRMVFTVLSIPVRQSYLMGVIEPAERASAAGLANFPAQVTSAVSPYLAGYFMQNLALAFPLEFAAVTQALNTWLYWWFFHNIYPPEESVRAALTAQARAPADEA